MTILLEPKGWLKIDFLYYDIIIVNKSKYHLDDVDIRMTFERLINERVCKLRNEETVTVWENPQNEYWETDPNVPDFVTTFEVTRAELHEHNRQLSNNIFIQFSRGCLNQ